MRIDLPTFATELIEAGDPGGIAVVDGERTVTRGELANLVAERRADIELPPRSIVVVTGPSSLEWVVTYLALIDAGHVPLLAGDHADRLVSAWSPAAMITTGAAGIDIEHTCLSSADPPPAPHHDLALLLSTSGSTGEPKLVRLSHRNLSSNARAIAEFLRFGPHDLGITSLPLHYCYGLSVLHAHLVAGAGIVVTEASVVDPCFRQALERHGVTNVAGVPHTFDLLERVGADRLQTPSMRLVTQAGGRLAPDAVERWLDRTEAWGMEFYVMYGQTEATARMAYLPPTVARRNPSAVGMAIPGGELALAPVPEVDGGLIGDDVGELVYRGPNVMLGYAETPADLTLGGTIDALRTGDLARFHADDGVFEIVGRRSRFVKLFGLRIDLDALERDLAPQRPPGCELAVAGDDAGLVIVAPGDDHSQLTTDIANRTGLPASAVLVDTERAIPRTASGKTDHATIVSDARARELSPAGPSNGSTASVTTIYAAVLGRHDIADGDTFVSLGGDSLSYIECSIRLESLLGRIPPDWHLTPVGQLQGGGRRHLPRIDTTILLRAIGICAVVATHMHVTFWPGGAHLLLAVVGFNLSRFMMPIADTGTRLAAGFRTAARAGIPTVVWASVGAALGASYGAGTLLLVDNYVGPSSHSGDHWHFWFIEVFVHVVVLTTLLMAVPAVRRCDRRHPFTLPLLVVATLLLLRLDWAQMGDWYNLRFRTHGVAWFFALGWLVHRSGTRNQRLLTSALCVGAVWGFFHNAPREWFIICSLLVLVWWREVPVPRAAVRPVASLAAASMWIYISHFTIWPPLVDLVGVRLAYAPTILLGVAIWAAADRIVTTGTAVGRSRRDVARRSSLVRMT